MCISICANNNCQLVGLGVVYYVSNGDWRAVLIARPCNMIPEVFLSCLLFVSTTVQSPSGKQSTSQNLSLDFLGTKIQALGLIFLPPLLYVHMSAHGGVILYLPVVLGSCASITGFLILHTYDSRSYVTCLALLKLICIKLTLFSPLCS